MIYSVFNKLNQSLSSQLTLSESDLIDFNQK